MKLAAFAAALALIPAAAHAGDKPTDVVGVPVTEPADAPTVHYPPPMVRLGVIGIGLVITGGAWGAAFGSATNWPLVPGSSQLKIPIVGPWIALGKSGCASDDPDCSKATIGVRGALYVLDGIAQLAGLALIAEGIVMKTEPKAEKKAAGLLRIGDVAITPVPVLAPSMHGLGIVGTF